MRDPTLHALLESFTADAAGQLAAETSRGAEIPFELVQAGSPQRGRPPLYCYRPLTGDFISERGDLLSGLPSYVPALRALAEHDGVGEYLDSRGQARISGDCRERADAALSAFLSRVFAERTEFGLDRARFDAAYDELEEALYEGQCVVTVVAPLRGLALESRDEVALDEEVSLVPGQTLGDAPAEAVWSDEPEPNVLVVFRVTQDRSAGPPVAAAWSRFRRFLTALRLFERGRFALGPVAWTRTDTGAWRTVAFEASGLPGPVASVPVDQEDELRAFCNLVARRTPAGGELAWALRRFEMGYERRSALDALTDYLLALRALLEPEGAESGRLAGRLAAICAPPDGRAALAEEVAETIALERAVITGIGPSESGAAAPVAALGEHLRAILRDVLCGHLDQDLCELADGLLAETVEARA